MDVKTERPAKNLQNSTTRSELAVEYGRLSKKPKMTERVAYSAPMDALSGTFFIKDKAEVSFLKKLAWLNVEQARIAEARYNSACLANSPYIFSSQVLGGRIRFMDGASAGDYFLAFEGDSEEKSEDGIAWGVREGMSKFHCLLPEEGHIIEFGTQTDLRDLGMSYLDIQRILQVNLSDSNPYLSGEELEKSLKQSRVLYSLLFRSGVIVSKNEDIARKMVADYSKEDADKTVIDLMVESAISTSFFVLKTAIQLGFDPNSHSEEEGTNALSAAIAYGKKKAVDFLLGYSGPQDVDYDFINSRETFLTKENEPLINWAKKMQR